RLQVMLVQHDGTGIVTLDARDARAFRLELAQSRILLRQLAALHANLVRQALVFGLHRPSLQSQGQGDLQFGVVPWFRHESENPDVVDRGDGRWEVAMTADQYADSFGLQLPRLAQEVQPVDTGHAQVRNDRIVGHVAQALQRVLRL